MNYYTQDVDRVWQKKIVGVFSKLQMELNSNNNITLDIPALEINEAQKCWGMYYGGDNPRISISRRLLNDFGIGAAEHVMGHEMAHMIVDKVFHMSDLKSHGEAFKKACGMLGIDPQRTISAGELHVMDENEEKRANVVSKIKKLMRLSESSVEAEAQKALEKAHELMLRYNVKSLDERQPDEYFIRPVGPIMKRMPNYVRDIAHLVKEYYFVNTVLTTVEYSKSKNGYWGRPVAGKMYEFFGTKENLDIAEYVFCALLQQAESLWEKFRLEKKAEYGTTKGIFSKVNFIEGVVSGYSSQLYEKKQSINRKVAESEGAEQFHEVTSSITNALIWSGDKLMDEMYHKSYPNLTTYTYNRNGCGAGFSSGQNAGRNLRISKGLSGGLKNSGRFLRA
jgi:predicted SprT family Zn-dependent metalloprotease